MGAWAPTGGERERWWPVLGHSDRALARRPPPLVRFVFFSATPRAMRRAGLTSEAQPSDASNTRELAVNEYDTAIRTAINPLLEELPSISDSVEPVTEAFKAQNQWTTGLCDWCAPPQGQGLCKPPPLGRRP